MLIDQERERRNDARRYRSEGRQEGEAIGERNAKRIIVQSLINEGFDDKKIAYLAGVDESFVRQQRR